MAVAPASWLDTRRAFDGVAAAYHHANEENPILRGMRRRALRALTRHVPDGGHILDLGCGPGTDDELLGRLGYRVTAIDWAPAMVQQASARIAGAGLSGQVAVCEMGIHEIDRLQTAGFDAVYSNFGPLNCVADLSDAAQRMAAALKPGGVVVASVIGRFCPWELLMYLRRGDTRRATVRFARGFVAVPLQGESVWTQYYTPAALERIFAAAGFARVRLRALGLFVPPPYAEAFARRHPRLIRLLQGAEDMVASCPGVRQMGDHFLIVLRKR
jgi:SAM-dependent methyltransferase